MQRSVMEINAGIIVSCMPTMPALIQDVRSQVTRSLKVRQRSRADIITSSSSSDAPLSLSPGQGLLVPEHMASFHVMGLEGSGDEDFVLSGVKTRFSSSDVGMRHGSRGSLGLVEESMAIDIFGFGEFVDE
ncbi:MAG: hypothetical protein Q9200_005947 [Gallowayella weberi]